MVAYWKYWENHGKITAINIRSYFAFKDLTTSRFDENTI